MTTERINTWRTWMQAENASHNTVTPRIRRISQFAEFIAPTEPEDARTIDVVNYLASLDIKSVTKATYHSHLKAWFKWLVVTEYRDDNPMDRVKAPRVPKRQPRPVTEREFEAILNTTMHKRTRMMVYLAAFQGLRCHEIAKIRGDEVNLKDLVLTVTGKGGKTADLPIHPVVADFARYMPQRGWWFPTYNGNSRSSDGPILPRSVSGIISKVFERASVAGGAHRLRHWHGTELLKNGVSVRIVQTLLRHSDLSTTALYTEVNPVQQRDAIQLLKMPGMFGMNATG